jgi:hypothetical protein
MYLGPVIECGRRRVPHAASVLLKQPLYTGTALRKYCTAGVSSQKWNDEYTERISMIHTRFLYINI